VNTSVMRRMPGWQNLVWIGVVGSVLAWAWAWVVLRGPTVVMLFVALASVVLAYRARTGMRLALVGLMVAGFAMFLASLYFTAMLFVNGGQVTLVGWLTASVFPMVSSIFLLLGAITGYRHARDATTVTTPQPEA
jgi:hypothetical protein